MVRQELGLTIDIHLGGGDLVFPHHENEIAQSETANGTTLAKLWMHNGMVNVGGTKMSKSLGNFTTIRALLDSGVSPMTLRLFVLQAHYRKPLDFTAEALDAAASGWKGLNSALLLNERHGDALGWSTTPDQTSPELDKQRQRFIEAMDDDLNSSAGLAVLFELARPLRALANRLDRGDAMNSDDRALGSQWTLLQDLAGALGLATEITAPNVEGDDGARIDDLIEARKAAKASKNYGEADRIRDELLSQGIELIDKPGGITEWVRA
jgi:cysteinyl-tRNA synthetase